MADMTAIAQLIAENRTTSWQAYLATLPGPGIGNSVVVSEELADYIEHGAGADLAPARVSIVARLRGWIHG